jgi:acyl carrier protein
MTRTEVLELIIQTIRDVSTAESLPKTLNESTRIFGGGGTFDSLGLVTLITEVEALVNDRCGTAIVIASEKAMSQQRSPFRSVCTLADYVTQLLTEEADGAAQS